MNLSNKNLREHMLQFCGSLDENDGLNPRFDQPTHRKIDKSRIHRQQRLCRQIANTLTLTLSEAPDPMVAGVRLVMVQPRQSSRSVTVSLGAATEVDRNHLMARLKTLEGWLRCEIAGAISRKRVPRLVFKISQESGLSGSQQ